MKRSYLIIALFTIITIQVAGQNGYVVRATGNFSILPTSSEDVEDQEYNFTYYENFDGRMGFGVFAGRSQNIGQKFSIDFGVGIDNLVYKRNLDVDIEVQQNSLQQKSTFFDGNCGKQNNIASHGLNVRPLKSGNNLKNMVDFKYGFYDSRVRLYYLSLPVHFNYRIIANRFTAGAGITPSFLAYSKQFIQDDTYTSVEEEYEDTSSDGLSNFVISANVNLSVRISGHVWATASLHQGLTPVYDKAYRYAGKSKVRYLEAGIIYSFGSANGVE